MIWLCVFWLISRGCPHIHYPSHGWQVLKARVLRVPIISYGWRWKHAAAGNTWRFLEMRLAPVINLVYHPFQDDFPGNKPGNKPEWSSISRGFSIYFSNKPYSYHPVWFVSRWFSMKQTIQRGNSPSSAALRLATAWNNHRNRRQMFGPEWLQSHIWLLLSNITESQLALCYSQYICIYIYILVGGWATPLKHDGVRQLGWLETQD